MRRPAVLFLCTGNSCRSQMAEGWSRALFGSALEAYSAGTAPKGLDPRAVRAMAEVGIDITRQRSKHLDELAGVIVDLVVTVCDAASQSCPAPAGPTVPVLHVPFDDPPRLAESAVNDEEALDHYRRVRDQIRAFVERLPELLDDTTHLA